MKLFLKVSLDDTFQMIYPKLFGFGDLVRFLGVSKRYVQKLIEQERIYYQRTSSGPIFFEKDVLRLQKEREQKSAAGDRRIHLKKDAKKS